jgi:hypothetical protein
VEWIRCGGRSVGFNRGAVEVGKVRRMSFFQSVRVDKHTHTQGENTKKLGHLPPEVGCLCGSGERRRKV